MDNNEQNFINIVNATENNLKHGFLRKKNGCEEKNHFTAVFVLIFL